MDLEADVAALQELKEKTLCQQEERHREALERTHKINIRLAPIKKDNDSLGRENKVLDYRHDIYHSYKHQVHLQ